jgi:hypothetical protein
MNYKHDLFQLQRVFQDNPSFIVLVVCCGLATFFLGMVVFPRLFRRMRRRLRELKRKAGV